MANQVRRFTKKFIIICNIIAGVLFLLGAYGYLFNPQKFWFMGLLTLANFYFLLLLLAFIFFWLVAKPAYSLISIAIMLMAWVPLKHLFKIRLSHNFELKKADNTLRVMSWNVEHFKIAEHKTHPEKKLQMLGLINNYNPDVACYQEMVASDKNPNAINNIEIIAKPAQTTVKPITEPELNAIRKALFNPVRAAWAVFTLLTVEIHIPK